LDIQWIKIHPGKVFIGSDNRSVLFGGIGPRHEVKIDYEFEISFLPVIKEHASKMLLSNEYNIASESEWALAFKQGLISGNNEVEELTDRIRGSYWSKFCDGRPFLEDDWLMKSSRSWNSGTPSMNHLSRGQNSEYLRIVKRPKNHIFSPDSPQLPRSSDKYKLLSEEFFIAFVVGIAPSFLWAYFNASDGYISEGWLNLVFGGLFIGVFTVIFWRPKTTSWRVGTNCGKMKPV
jgi:hypothetical protein